MANGYSVLNIDRLGLGYSDRPPAAALGYQQDAFAIHQIVMAVRTGALSQFGFKHIVLVAHSYGSTISIVDSATYNDVSAFVLTGVTHHAGSGVGQFVADIVPADQDPVTAVQQYPADYQIVKQGSIGPLFYYPQTSLPSVVATNESIKGVSTAAQNVSINNFLGAQLGESKITVPVLTVFGDKDILFGDNGTQMRLQTEGSYYPSSPRANVFAIPNTGHALALSTTFSDTNSVIFEWLHSLGAASNH